jgi:hypothetical protein
LTSAGEGGVSEIAAFAGDSLDRPAAGDLAEDILLVLADLLGARQHISGDVARDADRAVAVREDHIAGAEHRVADFDRDLAVLGEAAAERAVGDAVFVVDGEGLFQDLFWVSRMPPSM